MVAELGRALALLTRRNPSLERLLWEPRFLLAKPACLRSGDPQEIHSNPRSLISESQGLVTLAGNLATLRANDGGAEQALAAFQESIAAVATPILLKQGVSILISNKFCLHGRGAINYSRRWLQRAYARDSLEALRHACARPGGLSFPLSELIL
jgi:hypothetical protein